MSKCEYPGTHHSDDIVQVWHGRSTPTYLCGWHATDFKLSDVLTAIQQAEMREVESK